MTKTVYEQLKDKWVKLVEKGQLNYCFDDDIECYGNFGMGIAVGEWSTHISMGNFDNAADALAHLRFGNIPWMLQSNYDSDGKIKPAEKYLDDLSDKESKILKKMLDLIDSALKSDENDLNIINKNSENVFHSIVELYNEIFDDLPFHSCIQDWGKGSDFRGTKYLLKNFYFLYEDEPEDHFDKKQYPDIIESIKEMRGYIENKTFDETNPDHQKLVKKMKEAFKILMTDLP